MSINDDYALSYDNFDPPDLPLPLSFVSISSLQGGSATVVEVTLVGGPQDQLSATGDSWRDRDDEFNPELGEALALKRALDKLSAKLGRRVRALEHEAENNKLVRIKNKDKAFREQLVADYEEAAATATYPQPAERRECGGSNCGCRFPEVKSPRQEEK